MIIRPFEGRDVLNMIILGEKMWQESSYSHLDYDHEVLVDMSEIWIADPEWHYASVAEKDGYIFGMYVGSITQYYFGKDLVAVDQLLFIDPSKRGGIAAMRLIKDFEQWARSRGAKEVRPAVSTGVNIDQTKKLYESLGFETVGYTFKKEL